MNRSIRSLTLAGILLSILSWLPVFAETRIEKNLKLEPGGLLKVDSDVGSVEVTGRAGSGAHIVMTARDDDFASRFDISMTEVSGGVDIVVKKKPSLTSWISWTKSGSVKFEVEVPTKTRTHISTGGGHVALHDLAGDSDAETSGGHIEIVKLDGKVHAETSGGHITLKDISGDANVETSGGHIEADGVGGALHGETSGGHIDVANVGKDINVETSGGSIQIKGAKGRVDADTSGGGVEVEFAPGNARGGKIESSGGGITVLLDPAVNLSIDASSSGGRVTTDVPLKVIGKLGGSSVHGTLGNGGEMLTVYTSGGGVKIAPLGSAE